MKRLCWINPLSHYVYKGWLVLLNEFFNLYTYDHKYTDISIGNHINLKQYLVKELHIMNSFYNIYKNIACKDGINIIGDIFTNSLAIQNLFKENSIFYTEHFHIDGQSIKRTLIEKTVLNLFRNKKFIVPTKKSFTLISKYTSKIIYLPQLIDSIVNIKEINKPDKMINLLFVGNLNDWKKNTEVLFKIISELPDNYKLNLVGNKNEQLFKKYNNLFSKGKIIYHGFVNHKNLGKIYKENDIFLFPSLIDPIGAVVLEAMSNGLAILVSKNVGASDYVIDGQNGYILGTNYKDYVDKILNLNNNKIYQMKKESLNIVKENHYLGNKLVKKKYFNLISQLINDEIPHNNPDLQ